MAKNAKLSRRSRRGAAEFDNNVVPFERPRNERTVKKVYEAPRRVVPKNKAQGEYLTAIQEHDIVFGLGPAGTGKTHIATAEAAFQLKSGTIEKIYVTRPMEGGDEEEMGALPGTLEEKFEPWFAPVRAILDKCLGHNDVDCQLKLGNIVVRPLQFLRGATFENAFVIVDEAQNTSKKQMEMILTRLGDNCTLVINGDVDQCDIKGVSGLKNAVKILKGMEGIAFCEFTVDDIVRNKLVREIILRYRKQSKARNVSTDE
jgi:phosphate starvation-inducible PhoH-like protein